jgi:uncharacterized coiled-coil protein SlyX
MIERLTLRIVELEAQVTEHEERIAKLGGAIGYVEGKLAIAQEQIKRQTEELKTLCSMVEALSRDIQGPQAA